MTLSELREFIAKSPDKEMLQNYDLTGKNVITNVNYSLKGISGIFEYVSNQADGYSKLANLPEDFIRIKDHFIRMKANILQLIAQGNTQKIIWDDNLRWLINGNPPAFNYDSPETIFLLNINQQQPEYYQGAFNYFTGSISNITQKEYLIGYLLSYEFTRKEFSHVAERIETEKKSIASISAAFQTKMAEAESATVEFISKIDTDFRKNSLILDVLKFQKEGLFDEWFKKTTTDFTGFNDGSLKKIKALEDLYRDKLKLEAPARYWANRAKKIRLEGRWWLTSLLLSIAVSIYILIWVLNKIADGTIAKIFSDTSIAIKWSVVLITLISFLAYAIRIFSKLTFSSFHLSRDAEEREQLTYVYLALLKEQGVDPTERHLIMQSIFSRADTGLLKDDGAPTMPGGIADKLIK